MTATRPFGIFGILFKNVPAAAISLFVRRYYYKMHMARAFGRPLRQTVVIKLLL